MSVEVTRKVLSIYADTKVANPVSETPNMEKIKAAGELERRIALVRPSDTDNLTVSALKTWPSTPEYWIAGGEIVAAALKKDATRPLTCVLFAHLCVYALKANAAKFAVPIEVVELKKGGFDNHYILVAGRNSGELGGKLSEWNEDAFVIDLWGACQELGDVVSQPPAIIVKDMKDYSRRLASTIPAWGE
ncbi:hypothetical protein [Spongiactinospora sp. TRM90649]|uniref:hypothetical protein n=1 Tax=Spongiactinospora sp. TRM90649 TaxID=3031114 RepID=UPI0023F856AE|nr:hypothetical protein [Spongiactinospora sp. TRM90649]MDF5758217.1 hypothetical protein [Spongiactinospora sp. TRM90649]